MSAPAPAADTATRLQTPLHTPRLQQLGALLLFLALAWLWYRGWALRDHHYFSAEKGTGYWLGLIGGSLMLALLLYPLRKHWRPMRHWGPTRYWFRTHMLFGLLGPTLVMFHANFGTGSLNSTVALFCMLLVAGSGLIGRFLYTRIHYGLYGSKASLQELTAILEDQQHQLAWLGRLDNDFNSRLQELQQQAIKHPPGLFSSMLHWLRYTSSSFWHYWQLRTRLRQSLLLLQQQQGWDQRQLRLHRRQALGYLKTFRQACQRVLEFSFYERLFALWHVVHMPFFLMLLVSGIVHVIAVHMY